MLKVPTRLLLHSREETGVASIDRIAFWCVPNQYQRTKCRFNEDPLVGPKRKSVGVFVCPFWVISGHCAVSGRCPLYPQKRTIGTQSWNVRFVPKADICSAAKKLIQSP